MVLYGPKTDVAEALKIWAKVLESVRTPNDYKILALDISQAREVLDHACLFLLENQQYQATRSIAEVFKKIDHAGVADERLAQAAEGMAWELQKEAKRLGPLEAGPKFEEVRVQFHRAAVAFEEAAAARAEEGQAAVYWRSAQCFLAAKDPQSAAPILNKFLKLEKNEGRLAEGWLVLAETFQALGNKENAQGAISNASKFQRRRLPPGRAISLPWKRWPTRTTVALVILQQNLTNVGPLQDREAHEKSIFKYAELHFLSEDFDKAALYYKEACQLYRLNPGVLTAHDQLALCYRKLAEQAERKMQAAKEETSRAHFQAERRSWLEQGALAYESLADDLEHRQRQNALAPRNSAFYGTPSLARPTCVSP